MTIRNIPSESSRKMQNIFASTGTTSRSKSSQEIDLVIDARMQDIAAGFRDEDRLRISERLKSMENRTYLWLHLTFDIIERRRSAFRKRENIEKLLSGPPYEVSDAYEKIVQEPGS